MQGLRPHVKVQMRTHLHVDWILDTFPVFEVSEVLLSLTDIPGAPFYNYIVDMQIDY